MAQDILRLNPAGLPDAAQLGYAQITVSRPGPLAFVSGQVAWSPDNGPVPTALADQTALVIQNLKTALDSINASPADILQMRIYALELTDETMAIVMGQITAFLDGTLPAITGVAVSALAGPDLQLEIEMTVQMPQ